MNNALFASDPQTSSLGNLEGLETLKGLGPDPRDSDSGGLVTPISH